MSTAQLFTSCFCVSATAFDLQCRCVLALYQNANYILFTGAQHDVPVLTVDRAKSVHDFNSLIYHAVLSSDGWLGSKHVSSLKIWSQGENDDLKKKAAQKGCLEKGWLWTQTDKWMTVKWKLGLANSRKHILLMPYLIYVQIPKSTQEETSSKCSLAGIHLMELKCHH